MIYVDRELNNLGEYPVQLKGSWMYFCLFKNHPELDGICQVYFNDKHKSGSVFHGEYMLNQYPDVYATWGHKKENGTVNSNRMFIRKDLRGKGLGPLFLQQGAKVLKHLDRILIADPQKSKYGNDLVKKAFDIEVDRSYENDNDFSIDIKNFEQPVSSNIFFYKRKISE